MTDPPKFPRVPHLAPGEGVGPDDLVLAEQERVRLLHTPVVVEEKLDGANVVVWIDDGVPRAATRGGADAVDRGGQRGRLRQWATGRADELGSALGQRYALYGEWLLRRHTVRYDRLPGPFVGTDVYDRRSQRFLGVQERDRVMAAAGVPAAPRRFEGTLGSVVATERLLGSSAFGATRAEGLVVRALHAQADPRLAKLVDPAWRRREDAEWSGAGEENVVLGFG